jgi:hypothetical protein
VGLETSAKLMFGVERLADPVEYQNFDHFEKEKTTNNYEG